MDYAIASLISPPVHSPQMNGLATVGRNGPLGEGPRGLYLREDSLSAGPLRGFQSGILEVERKVSGAHSPATGIRTVIPGNRREERRGQCLERILVNAGTPEW